MDNKTKRHFEVPAFAQGPAPDLTSTSATDATKTRNDWQTLEGINICLLYTSPSPRDRQKSRMPSSA